MPILKFDLYSSPEDKVAIFNHSDVKAYAGQEQADQHGFFRIVTSPEAYLQMMKDSGGLVPPVLVYDWGKESSNFIRSIRSSVTNSIYNDYTQMMVGKLPILRKLLGDGMDWVPKTVFDRDEIGSLGSPFIAKAANSYDSKGVEKFDSKRDVPEDGGFDLYQEMIPIDREFRVVLFRGKVNPGVKLLMALEKTPRNKKAKDFRVDEMMSKDELKGNENTKFYWSQKNLSKIDGSILDQFGKIAKYIFNMNPGMNFVGLDVALDQSGKAWFIEHNLLPSMLSNQYLLLYKAMYEDWYQKPIGHDLTQKIHLLSPQFLAGTASKYTFEAEDGALGNLGIDLK